MRKATNLAVGVVPESQFDEEYPIVAYPLVPPLPAYCIGAGGGRRRNHRRDVPRDDPIMMMNEGLPGVVEYAEQCRGAMRAMVE